MPLEVALEATRGVLDGLLRLAWDAAAVSQTARPGRIAGPARPEFVEPKRRVAAPGASTPSRNWR